MTNLASSSEARAEWAKRLGVSRAAVDLVVDSSVVDLHVDTFLWTRMFAYDPLRAHGPGPIRARWLGQADLPRLRRGHVSSAVWIITTNPLRRARSRLRVFRENLDRLTRILNQPASNARVVSNLREFSAARASGLHAAFLGVQGGNAFSDPVSADVVPFERLLLVTLVHLTDSDLGSTSSPLRLGPETGLSARGHDLVRALEAKSTLVDLAHASPKLFWDVVAMHDPSRPLIVSHTGLCGVHRHWRNLDDRQLRTIADTGGVIGILFHGPFLGDPAWGGTARSVARHIAYGIETVGPEHICLGSDWDGLIATPLDMPTCLELPRLVQALLDEGVAETSIEWVLGKSVIQLLARARP